MADLEELLNKCTRALELSHKDKELMMYFYLINSIREDKSKDISAIAKEAGAELNEFRKAVFNTHEYLTGMINIFRDEGKRRESLVIVTPTDETLIKLGYKLVNSEEKHRTGPTEKNPWMVRKMEHKWVKPSEDSTLLEVYITSTETRISKLSTEKDWKNVVYEISFLGTNEEREQFKEDLRKIGWKRY